MPETEDQGDPAGSHVAEPGAAFPPKLESFRSALDAGQDRMDSRVPLPKGTPELLTQAAAVLAKADEFCAHAELLTLPRSSTLLAFSEWTMSELIRQYQGDEPTPWLGPF